MKLIGTLNFSKSDFEYMYNIFKDLKRKVDQGIKDGDNDVGLMAHSKVLGHLIETFEDARIGENNG